MEKEISILKELINDLKREEKLIGYDAEIEIQAIENLIKGYKIEKLRNTLDEQSLKEALDDYIPKSKVKEKIEELEEEKKYYYSDYKIDELNDKIQVLQELMEDK